VWVYIRRVTYPAEPNLTSVFVTVFQCPVTSLFSPAACFAFLLAPPPSLIRVPRAIPAPS